MSKKGSTKNTSAKAKHKRLVSQKKKKLRKEKETTKMKLKKIMNKAKEAQDKTSIN